jgi:hypothetical protein
MINHSRFNPNPLKRGNNWSLQIGRLSLLVKEGREVEKLDLMVFNKIYLYIKTHA